jgi:PAS domain S-box-containing protein
MSHPTWITPEERFRLLLDAASDYAIFFMDRAGTIVEWSVAAEKTLGFSESEAIGQNGSVIFTPEDVAADVPHREMMEAARNGQAIDERWHQRKNGTRFFAVGRLVALRDQSGQLHGYAKIMRSLTERRALEGLFLAFADLVPIPIWSEDGQRNCRTVNEAWVQLTGLSREASLGHGYTQAFHPADASAWDARLRLNLEDRQTTEGRARLKRPDGSMVWHELHSHPLYDASGRLYARITTAAPLVGGAGSTPPTPRSAEPGDLEAKVRERTRELAEKSRQLEEFCYTIAHDLRAPLRTIGGYAELLADEGGFPAGAVHSKYLERIRSTVTRMEKSIRDLLAYSRVEKAEPTSAQVNLAGVIKAVLDEVQEDIRRHRAQVELSESIGTVFGDANILHHVLLNLISNAVKFHRAGEPPFIRIFSEKRGPRLRINVQDHGVGIAPENLSRVFRVFERAHGDEYSGTGVGLAIVAKGMERLNGSYGVDSELGRGSTFWIELPNVEG